MRVPTYTAYIGIVACAAALWLVSTRWIAATPHHVPPGANAAPLAAQSPAAAPRNVRRTLTQYAIRKPKVMTARPNAHFGIVLVVRADSKDPEFHALRTLPLAQLMAQTHQEWTLIAVTLQLSEAQIHNVHEAMVAVGIPKTRVEFVAAPSDDLGEAANAGFDRAELMAMVSHVVWLTARDLFFPFHLEVHNDAYASARGKVAFAFSQMAASPHFVKPVVQPARSENVLDNFLPMPCHVLPGALSWNLALFNPRFRSIAEQTANGERLLAECCDASPCTRASALSYEDDLIERVAGLTLLGLIHVKFIERCTGRNYAWSAEAEVQEMVRKQNSGVSVFVEMPTHVMHLKAPKHVGARALTFFGVVLVLEREPDDETFKRQRASVFKGLRQQEYAMWKLFIATVRFSEADVAQLWVALEAAQIPRAQVAVLQSDKSAGAVAANLALDTAEADPRVTHIAMASTHDFWFSSHLALMQQTFARHFSIGFYFTNLALTPATVLIPESIHYKDAVDAVVPHPCVVGDSVQGWALSQFNPRFRTAEEQLVSPRGVEQCCAHDPCPSSVALPWAHDLVERVRILYRAKKLHVYYVRMCTARTYFPKDLEAEVKKQNL